MDALEHLGLTDDADERAIKRAYAQRLKSVRPDVDPEGFQELHEAYQRALAYTRWRSENPDDHDDEEDNEDEIREEAAAAKSTTIASDTPALGMAQSPSSLLPESPDDNTSAFVATSAPFDFEAFYTQLIQVAGKTDAAQLLEWLAGQSAHWSLAIKSEAGWRTLGKLRTDQPTLTPEHFDTLIAYFGFDDVLAGADPIAVFHLRSSIVDADSERRFRGEFEPNNMATLIARMARPDQGGSRAGYRPFMTRLYMRLLRRRFAYWWAFPLACLPQIARRVALFIERLGGSRLERVAPLIDARHISFWPRAQRGQKTQISRSIFFARAFAFYALIAAFSYWEESDRSRQRASPAARPVGSRSVEYTAWEDPDYAAYMRGNALQANRQHQGALQIFDQILRRRSADTHVWIGQMMTDRIYALAGLGRLDEMVTAIDTMVAHFGDSKVPQMHVYLAQVLYNKGAKLLQERNYAQALAVFDEMLTRFDPATSDAMQEWLARAHFYRGNMLLDLGRNQDAIAQYDTYQHRFGSLDSSGTIPRLRRAHLNKAHALAALGRRDEAIAVYRELEARWDGNTHDPAAVELVAQAQISRAGLLDRREDAIAIYDALIQRLAGHADGSVRAVVEKARQARATGEQALAVKK